MALRDDYFTNRKGYELSNEEMDAQYLPQAGERLTLAQIMAQPTGAINPNAFNETQGWTVQQFLNSPYSQYVPNGDGTYSYRGTQNGWTPPTAVNDPNDAGSGGIGHSIAFAAPYALAALGGGAALGGLAGLGIPGMVGSAPFSGAAATLGEVPGALGTYGAGAGGGAIGGAGAGAAGGLPAGSFNVADLPKGLTEYGGAGAVNAGDAAALEAYNVDPMDLWSNVFGGESSPYTTDWLAAAQTPSMGVPGFDIPGAAANAGALGQMSPTTLAGILSGQGAGATGGPLGWLSLNNLGGIGSALANLGNSGEYLPQAANGLSLLEQLKNGASSLYNGLGGASNFLGTGMGAGDLAARLAPGAAALAYAKNSDPYDLSQFTDLYGRAGQQQAPLDTSRLSGLYDQIGQSQSPFDYSRLTSIYDKLGSDPNLNPNLMSYDLQSGAGRNKLNSSLAKRGVLGSSFGTYDQNSYDTMRGLGRSALLGQGLAQQAGIAQNILSGQAQERQLYNQNLGQQAGIAGNILTAQQNDRLFGQRGLEQQQSLAKDMLTANISQQALKDARYGRAFDVFGRALSPGPTLYTAGR